MNVSQKYVVLLSLVVAMASCGDDKITQPLQPAPDAGPDLVTADDMSEEIDTGVDMPAQPTAGGRVEVDLSAEVADAEEGNVRVYQVESESDLIEGDIAHGKVGDWILENDRARFLIEADDRVMNPCPYGGNVLDAAYKQGGSGEDILGEVCLFVNAGLTLDPEEYEVIEVDENAAVLAVTGQLAVSDYLNIEAMVGEFVPNLLGRLPLDPDALIPVTTTIYYVLRPQDLGLRVITAFRSDAEEGQIDIVPVYMIMSGGDGRYFNSLSSNLGFGSTGSEIEPDPASFVGFRGVESSYLYFPDPSDVFDEDLPAGGSSLTIAGVAAVAVGIDNLLQALLSNPAQLAANEDLIHLQPGESDTIAHWHFVGDGALSTMLDEVYPKMGLDTTVVSGVVVDDTGTAIEGARVTAIETESGRTFSQALSGTGGEYSMSLPSNRSYEILARVDRARYTANPPTVEAMGESAEADNVVVNTPAMVNVSIRRPDGSPTPARVTFSCVGECPGAPTSNEEDTRTNRLPGNWAAVQWADPTGDVSVELAPGDYRVTVTRGFEWSMWPHNADTTGGTILNLAASDEVSLNAEIEKVVDSQGMMSADFHIHSLPSPDSVVPQVERVKNFVAEGVDVLISTDHDIISDFEPAIATLQAEAEVVSITGAEVTTSDIGHYNAFPLALDPEGRRGGSPDWSPGAEPGYTPEQLFARLREFPDEQVIQANHPSGMGLINNTIADPLRGLTFADRSLRRLPEAEPDPDTGDTGLWSEDFTAMEVMTGAGLDRFWGVGRWWLQMVGRGFTPTATVVTDTHNRYSALGGSPRSFVMMPDGSDTPLTFDRSAFVEAVNAGRVVGSRGPIMRVMASNAGGESVGLGETIATDSEPVTITIELEIPEWMEVDVANLYINLRDEILTEPGETSEERWMPTITQSIELDPATDLVEVSTGTATHRKWVKTIELQVDTAVDAYVVASVEGSKPMNALTRGQTPFAFANPIYLDADGNGYDNPPLADLVDTAPQRTMLQRSTTHGHSHDELTTEVLYEALTNTCSH